MKKTLMAVAGVFVLSAVCFAQEAAVPAVKTDAAAPVQVAKLVCGTGVENRDLKGEATSFNENTGRVYCWCKMGQLSGPVAIKHVWYRDGVKVTSVELNVDSGWRTWSSSNISQGSWKVDATDLEGAVLASAEFKVDADQQPAAAQ